MSKENDFRIREFSGDISDEIYSVFLKESRLAFDIETSGLDWQHEKIGTCQIFAPQSGISAVVKIDRTPEHLRSLLKDRKIQKIFHHAMFDLRFIQSSWNMSATNIVCTKVGAKLLRLKGGNNGLKSILSHFLNVSIEKQSAIQKSNWRANRLSKTQLIYAVDDVLYLPELFDRITLELRQRNLYRLAQNCYRHLPTQATLEVKGFEDVFKY